MPRIVPSLDTAPRDSLRYLLSAGLVIAALYLGAEIFVPTALAILLSFVLAPGVRLLRRWHLGRVLPVLIMTLLAFLLIVALGALMALQLRGLIDAMPQYQSTVLAKIEVLRGMLSGEGLSRFSDFVSNLGQQLHASQAAGAASPGAAASGPAPVPVVIARPAEMPLEVMARYLMPALHPLAVAGLVAIYAVFILLAREDLRNRAIRLFGAGDLHRSTAAIDDAARRLSRYLLTQLAVNTVAGLLVGLGLWAIGVPSPVLWGILFGFLRFVPYVGPPLAALAPLALAAAVAPGWSTVFWTAGLFAAIEAVVGQVIEPFLYGHNTGLSPLAVVVAATFWTVLWGPVGLVLSTPMTVCLVVLGRHVEPLGFLAVMLGDRPALAPQEVFYQRLLADDPVEASEEAERLLKDMALPDYYDAVLLPGLLLAQDDVAQGRLDADRQGRIAASVLEVVENLSDPDAAPAAGAAAGRDEGAPPDPLPEPWRRAGAVLCIGSRGALDDAAAAALAQLLARRGFGAVAATHDMLNKARIGGLALDDAGLVVLSSLDGSSPAYLRFALRRLERRKPGVPLLVGAWWRGAAGDAEAPGPPHPQPDAAEGRDAVASLADAVDHAVRLAAPPPPASSPPAAARAGREAAVSRA
ncbi:AI-2E family transporter [Lichenibacterium ramalinae]|uniref:AI-2E family transporter n=1 Tax=Lichenibacterium ramalinae TaxID=2316527 RepID=A0A4Q2R6Q2_9HYPH|nr:AI-2E family transporter [Lichenibacterium ramalinae]RYB01621.1 AI-2E family transporter [Lichenibacterium ramalinae]